MLRCTIDRNLFKFAIITEKHDDAIANARADPLSDWPSDWASRVVCATSQGDGQTGEAWYDRHGTVRSHFYRRIGTEVAVAIVEFRCPSIEPFFLDPMSELSHD